MRAIGFLIVLTIIGFGIYMVVSPANPGAPSGADVKREMSEAFQTTKDYTKGKIEQLGHDTQEAAHNIKETAQENYQAAKEKIRKAFSGNYTYEQRESYQRELETELNTWQQKSRDLENRIIQEGLNQELASQLSALKNTQQEINTKMAEISTVTKDRWNEFQNQVSQKMSQLENTYEDLSDKVERTAR